MARPPTAEGRTPDGRTSEGPRRSHGDVHAGRRLALAMESLGEALASCEHVPEAHRALAEAVAQGRSSVPADGERSNFPAHVASRVDGASEPRDGDSARALEPWLGASLAAWLAAAFEDAARGPWVRPLRDAVELACDARRDLLAEGAPLASVYARWYGEGLDERARAVYAAASEVALGEACDRWCALGCEGNLERYVATWQRSASGWSEAVLGTAVDVPVNDLGRLRTLQSALKEIRRERPPPRSLPQALAGRLALPLDEVERLLALEATVRERLDPQRLIRRRWALVKPIADAVAALEKERGRTPSVSEIAARARVHAAAVELVMEALGDD